MIFDLDNRAGGKIWATGNATVDTAALEVECLFPGKPAISILSTASGAPLKITTINSSVDIDSISTSAVPAVDIRSGATAYPALTIGKTVNSGITQAALRFLGTSVASAALMQFSGGFISCTSITITTAAITDYAIPVVVGGEVRYIPLITGAGIVGGAAF